MNNISTEVREGFLGYLESQEPALAQDVQRTMFTFEDIAVRIHGRDVAGVLRDVPEEVLLKALKLGEAKGSATVAFILENLPRRLVRALRRGARRPYRRHPQGGRVGPDRDHQGDPGPGQGRRHPLHREGGRLRLRRALGRSTDRADQSAVSPPPRSGSSRQCRRDRSSRPGSWRGTAGGSPRRSRRPARRRSRW